MISGVHHTDLVVSSLERSLPFYQELLGWTETGEIVGEQGERVVYIWPPGRPAYWQGSLGLREKQSDAHGVPFDRYAVGFHHIAFFVESREAVEERADWLRSRGIEIESGPKEYDYMPGYYAVFFYDPDGMKLEILHHPPRKETS
ncbi:MAG: VOC family protein [Actinomycetota bacterium]|nr:VOC family protein [Actinomycetota bacterium]